MFKAQKSKPKNTNPTYRWEPQVVTRYLHSGNGHLHKITSVEHRRVFDEPTAHPEAVISR